MDTSRLPWARAAVVATAAALVMLAVVFSCDPPSPAGRGTAPPSPPSTSALPSGATGATYVPTVSPVTGPTPGTAGSAGGPAETADATPMDVHDQAPPSPSPAPVPPAPAEVDPNDPVAVSRAAVITMWTVDTTKDLGPSDAIKRAAPYLSQAIIIENQAAQARENPSRDWQELAGHNGRTVVSALLADEFGKPPDTPTDSRHTWALTVTPVGDDDWRGLPDHMTVFVTLSRATADQPWKVTDFQSR